MARPRLFDRDMLRCGGIGCMVCLLPRKGISVTFNPPTHSVFLSIAQFRHIPLSRSLFHLIPPISLSPGIMMCRDICVLDCCLSWAVWLQRAKQHWTGPGQPGSSQRKVSQQKLAGCWLYLKLRGQDNIVKGLIMFFFFSSCLFPRGTEEGKQSKAELEGV